MPIYQGYGVITLTHEKFFDEHELHTSMYRGWYAGLDASVEAAIVTIGDGDDRKLLCKG